MRLGLFLFLLLQSHLGWCFETPSFLYSSSDIKKLFSIGENRQIYRWNLRNLELEKTKPNQAFCAFEDFGGGDCHTRRFLSYQAARKFLFGYLHLQNDAGGYYIKCVYCNTEYHETEFGSQPPAPDAIPDPRVINTEHTWPQSRFSKKASKDLQKSDLHALFTTTPRANTSRSNLEFGRVSLVESRPCEDSQRGQEKHKHVFEPPDSHKGNVARALFYFSMRYHLKISPREEETLRIWNQLDPVDEDELWRNDEIEKYQGNRNPFIDHPEAVSLIQDF
ncbi:MAG: endonuclease [Bdellovibrionales bacterium]|nr:endonuclease [Bdellovibrionales bacterium]